MGCGVVRRVEIQNVKVFARKMKQRKPLPHHFETKDFEILDFDPPNNPISHYGACHFGYNLALKGEFSIFIDFFFKGPIKTAPQEKNRGTTQKGLS